MISCPLLSYGIGHHLFHQVAELSGRFPGYRMATSSFFDTSTLARLARFAPRLARTLARRSHPGVPDGTARSYPIEHVYQAAACVARRPYSWFAAHDRMARRIVRDFAPPPVVLAIDTGAEGLFRAWQGKSRCVLDLTIALPQYREKIFTAATADPAHAGVRFHHPGAWELERYAAETRLADLILCPSDFVLDSCRDLGVPNARLRLLPYGFDPGRFAPNATPRESSDALRIVFVGTFCTRKGSHLLLPAFRTVRTAYPAAELHVFGDVQDAPTGDTGGVQFHGRIPQTDLAARLRTMHVMAFPTLFEGSAYAVYQALASGVPVVTTRSCGSIVDATCGRILAAPSAPELAAALLPYAENNALCQRQSAAAVARVRDYTWRRYGDRLEAILVDAFPLLAAVSHSARA